jgi:hypothetical protein
MSAPTRQKFSEFFQGYGRPANALYSDPYCFSQPIPQNNRVTEEEEKREEEVQQQNVQLLTTTLPTTIRRRQLMT